MNPMRIMPAFQEACRPRDIAPNLFSGFRAGRLIHANEELQMLSWRSVTGECKRHSGLAGILSARSGCIAC